MGKKSKCFIFFKNFKLQPIIIIVFHSLAMIHEGSGDGPWRHLNRPVAALHSLVLDTHLLRSRFRKCVNEPVLFFLTSKVNQ